MRTKQINQGERRVLVVVCDKGEEALKAITDAVTEQGITAARVTAVGGFQAGVLGYFDRQRMEYRHIPVHEQVEVLSLLGDVAEKDGKPALHLHAVVGGSDGTTMGGHLLRGDVWPTLEVLVTEVGPELAKRYDPETGLALLNP